MESAGSRLLLTPSRGDVQQLRLRTRRNYPFRPWSAFGSDRSFDSFRTVWVDDDRREISEEGTIDGSRPNQSSFDGIRLGPIVVPLEVGDQPRTFDSFGFIDPSELSVWGGSSTESVVWVGNRHEPIVCNTGTLLQAG